MLFLFALSTLGFFVAAALFLIGAVTVIKNYVHKQPLSKKAGRQIAASIVIGVLSYVGYMAFALNVLS